jgi:hypothetical protein
MGYEEVIEMKIGDVYPGGNFLSYKRVEEANLFGKTLTIKTENTQDFKENLRKIVLSFEEIKEELALNKTNAKALAKMYNKEDSRDWIGEKLILVRGRTTYKGESVNSIFVGPVPKPDVIENNYKRPEQ